MRQTSRRIARWSGIVLTMLLACTLISSSCLAEGRVSGDNMIMQMQEAAKIQLVTNKFIRCMEIDSGNGKLFYGDQHAITTGDIFADGGLVQTDVLSGAWLEQQVQGKVDNGTIWCSNNNSEIVKVFMRTLGITSLSGLYCNGDHPGIMSMQVYRLGEDGKVNHWETTDAACQIGVGNGDYKFERNSNGINYIKQIYEQKKAESGNPYMVAFEDVSEFKNPTLSYFLYLNDFYTACAGEDDYYKGDINLMNGGAYFATPLKMVDPTTGKIIERYYSKRSIKKKDWDDSFVKDGPHTCEDVIDRINGDGKYSDRKDLASAISETIIAFRKGAEIEKCIDQYKEGLDAFDRRIQDYVSIQAYANGLHYTLTNQINNIRNGKFEAEEDDDGELILFDLQQYANDYLDTYYNIIRAGIAGRDIYDDKLLDTLLHAFREIANNITIAEDGTTITYKPDDATLANFNRLLEAWKTEVDRVGREIETAKDKLEENQIKAISAGMFGPLRPGDDASFGLWGYNEEDLALTCVGLDTLEEETKNIFSAAPPEIDTDWTGVTLPDNDWSFDNVGGSGGSDAISCLTEGSSLGWILCPAIEIIGSSASGLYDWIVSSWISVGESEMQASNSNGVYIGWKTFRDIANIIFVIMLIVVIFSQVTGLGLTNYGIKKTLPTLIMVAILVNLSFILCQIAVDATNIVGDGALKLFQSFPVPHRVNVSNLVSGMSTLITIGAASGVTAFGISIYGVSGLFAAMLIPALIGFVTILLSILFFFIVLAVRKAGIYILIVLSPVAVILYALPNTKNLFQRWMKLFTSLLIVYPICGILMGGGEFFSDIILGSDASVNFFVALVAALLQVVPFFMIPSLVRNSLTLAGNIGNKLGQMGNRLGRMAGGAINRSRWAQDRQQRLARDANIRRDTRIANRGQRRLEMLNARRDEHGKFTSDRDQRRYNRAAYKTARSAARLRRSAAEDAQAEVEATRALPTQGSMQYANMLDSYENAAREREINEWQASMLNGHMDYGSGDKTYSIDPNNLGKIDTEGKLGDTPNAERSLSSALLHYLDAYDSATDKNSDEAKSNLLKAQAIATRLLDAGGDNGQTIVTNALRGRAFSANGVAKKRNDIQSVTRLSEYIARNGKWMGQIKKTDVGSFSFLNDTANKTADIKSRTFYHTTGDKKITAANIPGLSDGFFEGIVHEIKNRTYEDANSEEATRLLEIDAAASRAMADERIASEIKPETRDWLNQIHEKAYEIQQRRWIHGSTDGVANVSQFKGYNSAGAEVSATGVDNDGYLVYQSGDTSSPERLMSSVGGTPISAKDLYEQNIRRYRNLVAGQSQEALKVPHKLDIPYVLDPQTNQYRVESEDYVQERTPWMEQQSNIAQLIGYNSTTGQPKNADHIDANGFLRDADDSILLNRAGGSALSANDAYDAFVNKLYADQRNQWINGSTNGKPNITQLEGFNWKGDRISAYGIDQTSGYLVDQNNNVLLNSPNGVPLNVNDAYRDQIQYHIARFRDLRPEEDRELNKILDYNAGVNIQHRNNQQT